MAASDGLETTSWSIVGAGRMGKMLGLWAGRLGVEVVSTWNRGAPAAAQTAELVDPQRALAGPIDGDVARALAAADVIWVTVVDDALSTTARQLAPHVDGDQIVVHTAGSLASTVLRSAGIGAHVGSIHPLLAVTDPSAALDLVGQVVWSVEGQPEAVAFGRRLLATQGVVPVEISAAAKPLYHAAAVTAANLLVSLFDAALAMAQAAGIARGAARQMLVPLARSCVANLAEQDSASALSGPAARGDDATIGAHRQALEALDDPQLATIYDVLTRRARQIVASRTSPDGHPDQ